MDKGDFPYSKDERRDTKRHINGFRLVSGKVMRRKRDESSIFCPSSDPYAFNESHHFFFQNTNQNLEKGKENPMSSYLPNTPAKHNESFFFLGKK